MTSLISIQYVIIICNDVTRASLNKIGQNLLTTHFLAFLHVCYTVAKPARQFGYAMQILNHYHYSFLYKLIVFTVYEHGNICIA